eukprot:scaffold8977_cov128-Isochrysis_galbana.AAC.4
MYTDAAFEPDDPRPAGLGACVYDPLAPVGHQWVVVSGETSPEVIGRWRARRQYIGQLEALAAVATYYTLADGAPLPDGSRSHALRGRDVIHYVDNFGALACLVKGDSRDPDIGRLAHVLSAILVSIRARPWMDYVRSAANIADLPSRFDIEGLWAFIPSSRHYGEDGRERGSPTGLPCASLPPPSSLCPLPRAPNALRPVRGVVMSPVVFVY